MYPKPPPFTRHGTAENRIEVSADEILEAIAEGRDVDVEYAQIVGNLDIRSIENRLKRDDDGKLIVEGDIEISHSKIRGCVYFSALTFGAEILLPTILLEFRGDVNFLDISFIADVYFNAIFTMGAVFGDCIFKAHADFSYSVFRHVLFNGSMFNEIVDFDFAEFNTAAEFPEVVMKRPASFNGVCFRENTLFAGLWNEAFRYAIQLLTLGKSNLAEKKITDFSHLNTTVVMDASSNPYLKRYIDDEQWIASWRQRSWWRKVLFFFWELTSHCGRSIGLWAFWSLLIAVAFGFLHRGHIVVGSVSNWYTPFYFSVVTFTTLGFGDVTPIDWVGQLWITLEVILGYVMLGGLISIFANKFARRS